MAYNIITGILACILTILIIYNGYKLIDNFIDILENNMEDNNKYEDE